MTASHRLSWMPELCRVPRLMAMLGLAELVVLVLALAPDARRHWTMAELLAASGYALWLALLVTTLLCALRGRLMRLPARVGAPLAVLLGAAVALVCGAILHALYTVVGQPGFATGIGLWRFSLGSAATTALITALALRYFHVSDHWAGQVRASARVEADALQARIRPHFLFNSMNLIAVLVRRDPQLAERAVLDLSDLFRAALGAGDGDATLADECALAERYLAIESLRLGERLNVVWERIEPLPWSQPLPRLVLQPLVENAVLHGISRLPGGGTVTVRLSSEEGRLHIRIHNPAPDPQAPPRPLSPGAGHAQGSIAHRLAWRLGPSARMTGRFNGGYYECHIDVPVERGSRHEGSDRR